MTMTNVYLTISMFTTHYVFRKYNYINRSIDYY